MEGHVNRKDFFYVVILILTFITVIVGAAFALYSFIFSQEEGTSAVYTGTLSIEYLSGNIINCTDLIPREKPNISDEENVYKNTFKVKNLGSLDSLLQVKINISGNQFSDDTLMYAIYDSKENELSSDFIKGDDSLIVADNIYSKSDSVEEFTLMIWINESGENQNSEMKKILIGSIQVDASQKID